MPIWLLAILLGFVEGLTEFIPVSSTGHLLIAEHLLKIDPSSFLRSDLFNVVIQAGAVLAVIPLFRDRLTMLSHLHEAASQRMLAKIVVAFGITVVGGIIMTKKHFKLPEEVEPIAIALIVGGIVFIAVETWLRGKTLADEISWPVAITIGLAQLIAAGFPGASRSGSTIILALVVGASRVRATEFSFLVGIPTMLAASVLKIFQALHHPDPTAPAADWGSLLLASIVAIVVSFIAVKWLLRYVQSHTFIGFGIYRIVAGALLLLFLR
ncbi:MAG: undecaprenyl-diphosphate phosphatase [Chthoniobacter sp.]